MSTSTLSHHIPGLSLFAEVSRFFAALTAAPAAKAAPAAAVAETASGPNIWRLYRMSAGMDSVNPELLAERIVQD